MLNHEEAMLQDLLQTFQVEAVEHIQTLNQALLQLERRPDDKERQELMGAAFRAAHSLKGAARAVSLDEIGQAAHVIENVLQEARDANAVLDADTCDALYDQLDAIDRLLTADGDAEIRAPQPQTNGSAPDATAVAELAEEQSSLTAAINGETIRVAVGKLDDLMVQAGELLVSKISAEQHLSDMRAIRNEFAQLRGDWREIQSLLPRLAGAGESQLREALNRHAERVQSLSQAFDDLDQALRRNTLRLGMVTGDLQDKVRRVRMVPFQTLALGLERAVRDAARSEGKQVSFTIEGAEVELDKKILETLKDPLLHLLRNAVGHGIESAETRRAAGKPAEGHVTLAVHQRGGEVRASVRDDGRGFDVDGLRALVLRSGNGGGPAEMDDDALIALAFQSGVSTASSVTAISGRGVGLDVVRQQLEGIQGRVTVDNHPGDGATIEMIVPTSLTMTRALLVRVCGECYALPLLSIEKIVEPDGGFLVGGKQILNVDERPLPLVSLAAILECGNASSQPPANPQAIIISVADQRLAILVDEVLAEQELAVKPLGAPLKRVRNLLGAALLGTGEPVAILNPADLVKSANGARAVGVVLNGLEAEDEDNSRHILVVDDSITTRTLEKNILETAGYQITTATDGTEALLRLSGQSFDLVISDVEMPNMNGFELTGQIRESAEHSALPVILVTSLESAEDRERGLLAGADAYIVKRGFDQAELLQTIQQLL